jgi:perosamine synthetase
MVGRFEEAFAGAVGVRHAVAFSSGTAALHGAMYAAGIGPGDEVIVPPMTFAASANCVVFQGGTPIFADVDPGALLIDPGRAAERIGPKTKALIAVDYAGQPCDYGTLQGMAKERDLVLVADACHALGAARNGRFAGSLADMTVFSFHPVKDITTGEGGMVTTDSRDFAERLRRFRNHGIDTDHRQREEKGQWFYEMVDLGYNYRITDFQCALGLSQLMKLQAWIGRRQAIAARYDRALAAIPGVRPLAVRPGISHAYHLYVVRIDAAIGRDRVFQALRTLGIMANVHYIPVHLHPFYRRRFSTGPGLCPVAEEAYGEILSLPMFPALSDGDVDCVLQALEEVARGRVQSDD